MRGPVLRVVLLAAFLVCPVVGGSAETVPSIPAIPPARLRDPDLFKRMGAAPVVMIYRLEGEWSPVCDSTLHASGSPLDCFAISGEIPSRSAAAVPQLMSVLEPSTWVRSRGWASPACPTLGFTIRGDSMEATLLVSLRALKATVFLPGEGSMGTALPESTYSRLAWCLWRIDPDNPEIRKPIQAELFRLGFDRNSEPPSDELWGDDVLPNPPGGNEFVSYDDPPTPITTLQPVYPEIAREAKIQGRVVLHVLVGADGLVKKIKTIHGIMYLEHAARNAVSQWVFKPALRGGGAIAAWVEVPVDFHF